MTGVLPSDRQGPRRTKWRGALLARAHRGAASKRASSSSLNRVWSQRLHLRKKRRDRRLPAHPRAPRHHLILSDGAARHSIVEPRLRAPQVFDAEALGESIVDRAEHAPRLRRRMPSRRPAMAPPPSTPAHRAELPYERVGVQAQPLRRDPGWFAPVRLSCRYPCRPAAPTRRRRAPSAGAPCSCQYGGPRLGERAGTDGGSPTEVR